MPAVVVAEQFQAQTELAVLAEVLQEAMQILAQQIQAVEVVAVLLYHLQLVLVELAVQA
jgi:hypothetical protein